MTEAEKRVHRCCFTGHRPEKLSVPDRMVIKGLETEIKKAIDDGLTVFITGMAPGADTWAAEIILKLRDKKKLPIKLIAASPHEGFEKRFDEAWQKQYHAILEAADFVKFVCPHYHRGCYQVRNEWMVDHSARVIAVWNGQKSGTKNTIDYANRVGVPVVNVL